MKSFVRMGSSHCELRITCPVIYLLAYPLVGGESDEAMNFTGGRGSGGDGVPLESHSTLHNKGVQKNLNFMQLLISSTAM